MIADAFLWTLTCPTWAITATLAGMALASRRGVEVGAGMSECQGCGEQPAVIEGLCIECVRAELCCPNQYAAARALCDCGGWAAEALRSLKESA